MGIILSIAVAYFTLGVVFAIPFALWGAKKVDPMAREGNWRFKVLLIPGSTLFWPFLLKRWLNATAPPEEWSRHRGFSSEKKDL